jgi:hypothetical protein
MKIAKILSFTLASIALLGITVTLSSCCDQPSQGICSQPECWTPKESFEKCNYMLHRADTNPYNQRNMGKDFAIFGDSIAAGGWCYEEDQGGNPTRCGFREPLESLLQGNLIAGFGFAGHTAENEVNGWTYPHPDVGELPGFAIVDKSVEKNPGAKRVYIHIGGNDIVDWLEVNMASVPMPSACTINTHLSGRLDAVGNYVSQIVERYIYQHSVPEVVVGSVHRLELNRPGNAFSCYQIFCPKCGDCYQCMNDVLAEFSSRLSQRVDDLNQEYRTQHPGSPDVVFFADHFAGFGPNLADCEISCDCVHLNCNGHNGMADIWWQARPVVPPIP